MLRTTLLIIALLGTFTIANADDTAPAEANAQPEPQTIDVADGRFELQVPGWWKQVEPKSRMLAYEFQVLPRETGDTEPTVDTPRGRMTVSQAGGTVEANMKRWIGQFRLGRDSDGADALKRETVESDPIVIHKIDISGTYFDMLRGPFGPKKERPDYRMLGAIVETPDVGNWYLKFYGPAELVTENKQGFDQMIERIEYESEAAE